MATVLYDMVMTLTKPLQLTSKKRADLERVVRKRGERAEIVQRARIILRLAEGDTYLEIRDALGCSPASINLWRKRFLADGIPGLKPRYRGSSRRVLTPELEARILSATRKAPPDGSTHWSSRRLGERLGINHMLVHRAWQRAGLKPHGFERYMASNDPNFESKATDIIGLYLNPPVHAAVFCFDEKTAIQALDRTDMVLPLSPGRAERHTFEYYRHGTLSLLAALDVKTGEVIGRTVPRHTSDQFVEFLGLVVASQPRGKEIHVILDNLSTHKTKKVAAFLEAHLEVRLHFTPTYSSWLNQVELWFSKLTRQVIARGVFKSVKDLARKILRFIKHHNENPKPFKWSYSDPSYRIDTSDSVVTVH